MELDYPRVTEEGAQQTKHQSTVDGGPEIGNFYNRLIYALKFQSTDILFSDAVNDKSQILYDRHHRLALGLARRMLADAQAAEDVVQEVFLAVWRQAERYRPERGAVNTWLLAMVHHRAADRLRRRQASGGAGELDETLVDRRVAPVWQQTFEQIRAEQISAALESLPRLPAAAVLSPWPGPIEPRAPAVRRSRRPTAERRCWSSRGYRSSRRIAPTRSGSSSAASRPAPGCSGAAGRRLPCWSAVSAVPRW